MCGRYTATTPMGALVDHFSVDDVTGPELGARWNVAPTEDVHIVVEGTDRRRRLGSVSWGLLGRVVNARAETLAGKPLFKTPFERRRCIVPADGWYEWTPRPGGGKQAWHLAAADGRPLAFAGLWTPERAPDGSRAVRCAIVTIAASPVVAPVHDRMPAVLPPGTWDAWLDRGHHDVDALDGLLQGAAAGPLRLTPVGPAVGNVANDGPELLTPVDPVPA